VEQNLTSADQLIIALYFVGMIVVGLVVGKKVKSSDDYSVAGRSLKMPLLAGTLIGSAIGASATFGKAGKAYEVGFIILFSSLAYIFGYLAFAWLGPRLRAAGIDTIPQALHMRFGASMRSVAAVVLLLTLIAAFGAQLMAFGIMASTILAELGISYQQGVMIAAVVIVLYTLVGGLLAVAYTDLVQVIIMLIGIGIILPLSVAMDVGSQRDLGELLTPPVEHFWTALDWTYLLAFIPTYFAFVLIDPSVWQRTAAAKDVASIKPAMIITAVAYTFWSLVVVTLGVLAFNLYPGLSSGDEALPQLMLRHLPPIAKGLCLSAVMAIMMSTADSALLIAGTTFSGDIIKPIRPQLGDQQQLRITRVVILLVGIAGAVFALERAPIFDMMMLALAIFVSGLFVPVMAALFWDRATRKAALSSAIAGCATELLLYVLRSRGIFDIGFEPILIALTVSALVMWIVSMASNRLMKNPNDISPRLIS
jgi:SSS family solute:Na+ symporter